MRKQGTPSETPAKSEQRRSQENLGKRQTKHQPEPFSGKNKRGDKDEKGMTLRKRSGSESNEGSGKGRGERRKSAQPGAAQASNNKHRDAGSGGSARETKKQGNSI